jgi:monooxygenase
MDATGTVAATPRPTPGALPVAPYVEDFSSGYMQRSIETWPKQGAEAPWRAHQSYFADLATLRLAPIDDGVLEFARPSSAPAQRSGESAAA